ncbi:c-type cytochrome [Pseudoduganella violaceinigra]|uniref:c-type cytochrome n=1 Tax=Pseudoduganella violaceinigra TaxID=246602 RepID=UPI00041736EF|nr:cytochrome c [Pseudoduganella violaceinigra]
MKKLIIALFCSAVSFSALAGGNIENGKALTEKYSCNTCHGKDFNTPLDPSYPKLAGQHKDYLVHALTAYKRGDKPNGRSDGTMTKQVEPLTNKDIQDIAAYLHSLQGSLVLKR